MKKIDELIDKYERIADSTYEDLIVIELERLNRLYDKYEDYTDEMFVDEMVDSFLKIIERQQEKISDLKGEIEQPLSKNPGPVCYETFETDKQIQEVFNAYFLNKGKSSYTVNDYCSRIKNLWRMFYEDFKNGNLPVELEISEEIIKKDSPLINVYNHSDALNCYIGMKMAENKENRNWANTRAAFNNFGDALCGENFKYKNSNYMPMAQKDFSKYNFNGEIYGKSRLVLAVVKQFAKENDPDFTDLRNAFPDYLQGSKGVVRCAEHISDKDKGVGGVKRYFLNENELIFLRSGDVAAVCTQWSSRNLEDFVDHVVNKLGYNIEKV